MTAQHTKLRPVAGDEYWSASHSGLGTSAYQVIKAEDGAVLALAVGHDPDPFTEPNLDHARRIAACWNACAGLSTSFLEDAAKLRTEPLRDLVKETEAERDEMLSALQAATAWMEEVRASGDAGNWEWGRDSAYLRGIAAIQKATKEQV